MKIADLIDDLTTAERAHGTAVLVTDQAGHEIDRVQLDEDPNGTTTVILVTR